MARENDRFTGGDGLVPGSLEHATHLVMMSNELNGGRGAYRISNAVLGASGPSFGPFQYDLGGNSRARELFEDIVVTAVDANGCRFISDHDLDAIRSNLYQPFKKIQADPAARGVYSRLLSAMNSALDSDAGRRLINDDYLVGINTKIKSVETAVSLVADAINRSFVERDRLAKLIILDTANQYGSPVNDGLRRFMAMNAQSNPMQMPGRRHAEQISVNGDFGIEDMLRYKLETQYGQTDAGARDVLRRISNIVDAIGVYDINLSKEDKIFFQTGLRQYLVDNGRDASVLDTAALHSLNKLGQITEAERTVACIQKNLNALGIPETQGQLLVIDGNLGGPSSRTGQAIAAFKHEHGLTEPISNAELLMATQVALKVKRSLDFGNPVRDGLPGPVRTPHIIDGMPDYLLSVQNTPSQTSVSSDAQTAPSAIPSSPHRPGPTFAPQHYAPPPVAEPIVLAPLLTTHTLEPGDRSTAVQTLQQHLQLLGATDRYGQKIRADKEYGERTREAVEQFQLWTGREATGIADPDTLQALQSQAQFALRQRGQGITIASDAHLAERLRPTTPDLADAAIDRPVPGQSQMGLIPFSHPNHPQHGLYTDLQQRFQAKGNDLSEEHLSALAKQMHLSGYKQGWPGDVVVHEGRALVGTFQLGIQPRVLDLNAAVPSVQETMTTFQADQQSLVQNMERLHQQQTQAHGHGLAR